MLLAEDWPYSMSMLRWDEKMYTSLLVDNDVYDCDDSDPDAIVSFKIKFSVEDPTTDIQLVTNKSEDGTITVTDLYFPVV